MPKRNRKKNLIWQILHKKLLQFQKFDTKYLEMGVSTF